MAPELTYPAARLGAAILRAMARRSISCNFGQGMSGALGRLISQYDAALGAILASKKALSMRVGLVSMPIIPARSMHWTLKCLRASFGALGDMPCSACRPPGHNRTYFPPGGFEARFVLNSGELCTGSEVVVSKCQVNHFGGETSDPETTLHVDHLSTSVRSSVGDPFKGEASDVGTTTHDEHLSALCRRIPRG